MKRFLYIPLICFVASCGLQPTKYPQHPSDTPEGDGLLSGEFSLKVAKEKQQEEFKQWQREKESRTSSSSEKDDYEEFKAWKEEQEYKAFLEWKKRQTKD